jgi:hypothetical protein
MWIEPRGFEEIHLRGNVEQHRLQDPSKWVPYGVGAIEGRSGAPLPVLEGGAAADASAAGEADGNGAGGYGPGEEPRPGPGEPTATANHELL